MSDPTARLTSLVLGGPRPLQRRLTVLTTIAVGITLAATCLIGWLALRATLFDINQRGSVQIAADLLPQARQDLTRDGTLGVQVRSPGSTVVEAVRADGTVGTVPGADVALVLGRSEVAAAQQQLATARSTTSASGEAYRLVTVPLGDGAVLVVGRPLASSYEVLRLFGVVVLAIAGVGVVWAWLLGRLVARTGLQPMWRFTEAVQHVAETEDLQAVSVGYVGGDLGTLTQTFNRMLTRIASSRAQQDQLIVDASHQLRTPLTSVRTNLELLSLDVATGRLTAAQRAEVVAESLTRTIDLSTLVSDLLQLARDNPPGVRDELDLRDLVRSAVQRVRPDESGVRLDLDLASLPLVGDAGRLEDAVTHLLDNAVRWSPEGGTVRVRIAGRRLTVGDEGPGIAAADLPRVFDRFYRARSATGTPGRGLGLAIAAKAVGEHGGSLVAGRSREGGALLSVEFPYEAGPTSSTSRTPGASGALLGAGLA